VVRVQAEKGDKYGETPLTDSLAATINAYADVHDGGSDDPLVPRTTRTVRDWVTTIGDRLRDETGDDGWSHLSAHDLRRTWGTLLVDDEVEPGLVMEWGGWEDWETFREAYLGPTRRKRRHGLAKKSTGSDYIHSVPTYSRPSTSSWAYTCDTR
jgi:integrase